MLRVPSLRNVNLLYLVTLALVAVAGSLLQNAWPGPGLAISEIFFILLPGWLLLRLEKLPVAQTVRFNYPGLRVMAFALLAGFGLSLLSTLLTSLATRLLGYTFSLPGSFYANDPLNVVLIFISMVVLAPLCEEFLFRGVIQPAYESLGAWAGILVVSATFALYHMSLVRVLSLLPVALALGWLAWRTRSLVPGIMLHMAFNWLAASGTFLVSILPNGADVIRAAAGQPVSLQSVLAPALVGLVIAALGLGAIELLVRHRESPSALETPEPIPARLPLRHAWALALAVLVALGLGVADMIISRNGAAQASEPLALKPGNWEETQTLKYRMINVAGKYVGDADCVRFKASNGYRFICNVYQGAFELNLGSSYYKAVDYHAQIDSLWAFDDLALLQADGFRSGDFDRLSYHARPGKDGLELVTRDGPDTYPTLSLPGDALLEADWAWRLMAADLGRGFARQVKIAYPLTYIESEQASRPDVRDGVVAVTGREKVNVPYGRADAWVVTYERETAWYAVDAAHTLLRYDNGFVIFELLEIR